MQTAETILAAFGVYAALGALFSLWFVTLGAARIDAAAKAMPAQARVMIFPGCVALWPLLAWRSLARKGPPVA